MRADAHTLVHTRAHAHAAQSPLRRAACCIKHTHLNKNKKEKERECESEREREREKEREREREREREKERESMKKGWQSMGV